MRVTGRCHEVADIDPPALIGTAVRVPPAPPRRADVLNIKVFVLM